MIPVARSSVDTNLLHADHALLRTPRPRRAPSGRTRTSRMFACCKPLVSRFHPPSRHPNTTSPATSINFTTPSIRAPSNGVLRQRERSACARGRATSPRPGFRGHECRLRSNCRRNARFARPQLRPTTAFRALQLGGFGRYESQIQIIGRQHRCAAFQRDVSLKLSNRI